MVVAEGGYPSGLQPSSGGPDYPLVDPSDDIRGLLADAHLSHRVTGAALPLRIVRLVGFGQPVSATSSEPGQSEPGGDDPASVLIVDGQDQVVFDSRTEDVVYQGRYWDDRFFLHEWIGDSAVCRIIQHTGTHDTEDQRVWPHVLSPERAILDERASEMYAGGVQGVTVLGQRIVDRIEISEGYNVRLSIVEDDPSQFGIRRATSRRAKTRVRIDAEPGLGLGRYPACVEVDSTLKTINRIGPDDQGGFTLNLEGCYYLERPHTITGVSPRTAEFTPGRLVLHNNCQPCCSCDDYVHTYRGLIRLHEQFTELGTNGEAVRDQFRLNKERWLEQKECREDHPTRLMLISQTSGCVIVQASVCNASPLCRYDVDLVVSWVQTIGPAGNSTVNQGSVFVSNSSGGWMLGTALVENESTRFHWDRVDASRGARARFTVCLPSDDLCSESVTVTAQAYVAGAAFGQPAVKSIAVLCEDGQNMIVCY